MRKFFKTGDCIIAEFELFWNMVELNFQNWGVAQPLLQF